MAEINNGVVPAEGAPHDHPVAASTTTNEIPTATTSAPEAVPASNTTEAAPLATSTEAVPATTQAAPAAPTATSNEPAAATGSSTTETVLVTGGSGFVGVHCILLLLSEGYHVRTTVRNQSREQPLLDMLKVGEATNLERLTFAHADLTKDDGWTEAAQGCKYVLHVASPFPSNVPKDENELIIPAREGTLRILRASRDAGVKRVVLTSSVVAVMYGQPNNNTTFTEENWTNVDTPGVAPYHKSKTLAERAAWDFIKNECDGKMEMATVNPVGVFGPVLGKPISTSVTVVERILTGDMPGLPKLSLGCVDVRDVASLHYLAMLKPEAAGERFICTAEPVMTFAAIAEVLRKKFPKDNKKVPKIVFPNVMVKTVAFFDPSVRLIVPELGVTRQASSEKAIRVLGWKPRTAEESIVASAESLLKLGYLKGLEKNSYRQ